MVWISVADRLMVVCVSWTNWRLASHDVHVSLHELQRNSEEVAGVDFHRHVLPSFTGSGNRKKKQNRNVHGHRRTRAAGLTNPENVVNIRICRLDVDFKY